MSEITFKTEQESFWSGKFGTDYIARNNSEALLASNLSFFSKALKSAHSISSCIEFGANIGMNLRALKLLFPMLEQFGIEINSNAASELQDFIGIERVFNGSIFDFKVENTFDLVLIKGVAIHINPDMLGQLYDKLYEASRRYILLCEYYNPSPVAIPYRGFEDKLFKRDFCGELLDRYPRLALVDYGFVYKRDPSFPQDDISWFLLKK